MLLLPASVTAREANDARRLLAQSMKSLPARDEVVIDATNLRQFDSSALAVLLDCERNAIALGRRFVLRGALPKLLALARLYGVESLLMPEAAGDDGTGGSAGRETTAPHAG